ncbi:MAG: hypothetical protein IPK83_12465 [Planctomycetes bacterium]|nr:hypothetical protein [Planctomycetota bacterium]
MGNRNRIFGMRRVGKGGLFARIVIGLAAGCVFAYLAWEPAVNSAKASANPLAPPHGESIAGQFNDTAAD